MTGRRDELLDAAIAVLGGSGMHGLTHRRVDAAAGLPAGSTWLRLAGSTDPERDAPLVMNRWTGLVLHELAVPDSAFDPSAQLTDLVTRVIRPEVHT